MYLAQIIRDVNNIAKFNQWRNISTVIKWFQNITKKMTVDLSNLTSRNFILQFLRSFKKDLSILQGV